MAERRGRPDNQPDEAPDPVASGRAQHCPEERKQGNRRNDTLLAFSFYFLKSF